MERKEAIEIVRSHFPNGRIQLSEALKILIPELKENEDERIRKDCIEIIKMHAANCRMYDEGWTKSQKCLTWLEKQGEQKHIWSEEDEYQINTILHGLNLKKEIYKKEGNKVEEERYNTQYNWLKSFYDKCKYAIEYDEKSKQPHWKPSEEQMQTLHSKLSEGSVLYPDDVRVFTTLYEDLQKLLK